MKEPDPSARVLALFGQARRIVKLRDLQDQLSSNEKLRKAVRPADLKRAVERELSVLNSNLSKDVTGLFDLVKNWPSNSISFVLQFLRPIVKRTTPRRYPNKKQRAKSHHQDRRHLVLILFARRRNYIIILTIVEI